MITWTGLQTTVKNIVTETGTDKDSFIQARINEAHKHICDLYDWPWLEKTLTKTSTASQQEITLPVDYLRLITYRVTNGTTDYTPHYVANAEDFDRINYAGSTISSNIPEFFTIRNGDILNYPAISSAGLPITIEYLSKPVDFEQADYAIGTITAVANNMTTVTGDSTAWDTGNNVLVGSFIQLPDNNWYEIATIVSDTSLTISKPYQGITVAAATEPYTIGDLPKVPEAFQDVVWLRAVSRYFMLKGDEARAKEYLTWYDDEYDKLRRRYSTKTTKSVYNRPAKHMNANYDPRAITIT